MTVNINGLISKIDDVRKLLFDKDPRVGIMLETHLIEDDEDVLFDVEGYNVVNCVSDSRHTGGILFYVREDVFHAEISVNVVQRKWWMMAMKVGKGQGRCATIVGGYRSPSCSKKVFLREIEKWLGDNLNRFEGDLIVTGDFNIDW